MKTWEVYKIALENPKARFKRGLYEQICQFDEKKQLQIQDKPSSFPIAMLDEEWELVREPVDFMTAINSGKKIRPGAYPGFCSVDYWFSQGGGVFITRPIVNGKWYIED